MSPSYVNYFPVAWLVLLILAALFGLTTGIVVARIVWARWAETRGTIKVPADRAAILNGVAARSAKSALRIVTPLAPRPPETSRLPPRLRQRIGHRSGCPSAAAPSRWPNR
jgi:hypothetical protein